MPSKHHRPAALQRRSTSGSNTKLTLGNLNLQKLDSSSNLQLQVALNNSTKDLPRGKGKKTTGRPNVGYNSTFQFFRSNPNSPCPFLTHRAFCHSSPQAGRKVINKSNHPLSCTCNNSNHIHTALRQVPPIRLSPKRPIQLPQPEQTKNPALPSPAPWLPLTTSKPKAIQTNGSQARVYLPPPRTSHPTRNLVTMTLFATSPQIFTLPAQHISRLPPLTIGNPPPQPSLR